MIGNRLRIARHGESDGSYAAGRRTIPGYAWAPECGVRRVDVRVNGGACKTWQEVPLLDPQINPYIWRRFELALDLLPGEYLIETRTMDNRGQIQPPSVPDNEGGYDCSAILRFQVRVA